MRLHYEIEDSELHMECKGKMVDAKSFTEFKTTLKEILLKHPQIKNLFISFDTFPLNTQILGLLLKYTNINSYQVNLLTSNYACFKSLEDLKLITKFNVKYQKEEK